MSKNNEIVPSISGVKDKKLSKLQKQFNYRTKRIKSLKKKIETLRQSNQLYMDRFHKEIIPIEDKIIDARVAFIKALDKSYSDKYFRKVEKLAMQEIIQEESFNLINEFGIEELVEVFDRYSDETYAEIQEESQEVEQAFAKSFIENMFDVELDDVGDLNNPEDFIKLQEEVQQKMEEREKEYQESRKKRKKTKAQQEKEDAKEQKLKEEAQNLSKTSRAIYTELVKEIHPDKEMDEGKKQKKTEIMKRVTEAYQKNDFFELLKLQIEYKQGTNQIESLKNDQLKYYNQILQDQVRELQQEEYMLTYPPPPLNQFFFNMTLAKTKLKDQFKLAVLATEKQLKEVQSNIQYIQKKANLRKFIREYIEQQNGMNSMSDPFEDLGDLSDLFFFED